jgi:two-component system response regulator HupR/HoxA
MAKLRILVVDDEPLVRRALARALRPHRVFQAGSYDEAAELLGAEPLDAVFCDNWMPGRSGVEVLALASEIQPSARRIMVTAHSPADPEALMTRGVIHRLFHKPWDLKVLKGVVKEMEDGSGPGRR